MKPKTIANIIVIIAILGMGFSLYAGYSTWSDLKDLEQKYMMRYDLAELSGAQGIYFPGSHYCVNVKDRSVEEIADTRNHEICHHFIYEDYKHFCGK